MEAKYLTIKQAAVLLGVSPLTLRNWDKRGRLVAHRHPLNNYRVYKKEEIDKLLEKFEEEPTPAPMVTIQREQSNQPRKLKINLEEE